MKLNVGCGFDKRAGYLNLDKYAACGLDQVMDAEAFPWPFETSSADEILFHHALEHMGADTEVFLRLIQKVYRVCRPGAKVQIDVPHPRHDNFINDPTHVRIVTAEMLTLFSKERNRQAREIGGSNTALADYLDVDFELRLASVILEERFQRAMAAGQISEAQMIEIMRTQNNVVIETQITLEAIKPA
ncbi:MAG TPA: methyltransferase domain-containing protein [Caulobacteraceae bacterium]|jgi:predicted SAM-dependent methyltransferase